MSIVNCDSFSKTTTPTGNDGIMFNDYILVQPKQKYLDSLKDGLDYVPKQC